MDIRYNPKKWYYWGRWVQVMLFISPWTEYASKKVYKTLNIKIKGDIKFLDGHLYFLKEDIESLNKNIIKNLKKNPEWFQTFFSFAQKTADDLLKLENKDDISNFIKQLMEVMGCSFLTEFCDRSIETYLQRECQKKNISYSKIMTSISFQKKTQLMKYKERITKIREDEIDEFVKEFKWVGTHGFEGVPLTKEKVNQERKNSKNTNKKVHATIQILQEFKKTMSIVSELSFLRSNLMETMNRVSFKYWPKLRMLGEKYSLSFFEVISLTQDELIDLEQKGKIPQSVEQRGKNFGVVYIDKKRNILLKSEVIKELQLHQTKVDKNLNEIKGVPAFLGKVRGRAKVLKTLEDETKVKKGDIIIAEETTPNYIIAMSKAAAFVTNVGGLTSHAATIAREMKKPCIIGTKIATKVFKDNDLIEVDAEKGIVKKI